MNRILRLFITHGIVRRFKVDGSNTVLFGLFVPFRKGVLRFYARGGRGKTRVTFTVRGYETKTVVLERGGTRLRGRFTTWTQ